MPGKKCKGEINIRLAKAIEKRFGSAAKMCRKWPGLKGKQTEVSALIHLKFWPWYEDHRDRENFGKFKKVCALIAEALDIFPEKLFPVKLYLHLIEGDRCADFIRRVSKPPAKATALKQFDKLTAPEIADRMSMANELRRRIQTVMQTLSYREREILKLRYGLNDGFSHTLDEVGHIFKVTREKIRQIEAKAVRKLQQPNRSQQFVDFLD